MINKPDLPVRKLNIFWDPEDKCMVYPIIQWFIANNNIGAVNYQGTLYNLMSAKERITLTNRLVLDGLITVQGVTYYDTITGEEYIEPNYLTCILPDYSFIHCQEERFFWINMVRRVLNEMTDVEMAVYNDTQKKQNDQVL